MAVRLPRVLFMAPSLALLRGNVRATLKPVVLLAAASIALVACAQDQQSANIPTTDIITSSTSQSSGDLPASVPGESLEKRLARLEYDLAQLKLDYSVVRPSFEQLVSREKNLDQRIAAMESALGPITASVPKAAPKPARKPATPAARTAARASGPVGLHLASYRNLDRLKKGWAELKAGHPAELTGLEARIHRIDTGKNGVFQRLLAGPIVSRTAADGLCQALSAQGVYCKTVTFSGKPL